MAALTTPRESTRDVSMLPAEHSLDMENAPTSVALRLLAEQLRALAAAKFSNISDLTCELTVDLQRQVCSLHFRACR